MISTITPEWVSAIAGGFSALAATIAAVGVIFAAKQLRLAGKQLKLAKKHIIADHERSKRELSISLMREWSTSLTLQEGAARKIVEKLSLDDCEKITKHEPLELPSSLESKVITALSIKEGNKIEKQNNTITLNDQLVARLNGVLIGYLNRLESTLMSWSLSVADRKIIEREFAYLYNPEDGHSALETFREAKGGRRAYPVVDDFIKALKKIEEKKSDNNVSSS